MSVAARIRRTLGAPLIRFFDHRFAELGARIDEVRELVGAEQRPATRVADERRVALESVEVSAHNAGNAPPDFAHVVSQVVSAAQFDHPDFQRIAQLLTGSEAPLPWRHDSWPLGQLERKLWEWCFILKAAEQHGTLVPGATAAGFGVGTEPIPAALARFGVRVLATDREAGDSDSWALTNQHMQDLRSLSKPHVVDDETLREAVSTRYVDMNDVPADLGTYDLIWSSCAVEHLGSPEAGIEFVLRTLGHVAPGGLAVHTTELELTDRESTADYGHLAVYRIDDLERLRAGALAAGCEMMANWYVALETPADRWIALPPYDREPEPYHLKLKLGDSVSTSVGLVISKPG